MDIAKIRKKARKQDADTGATEGRKRSGESPASPEEKRTEARKPEEIALPQGIVAAPEGKGAEAAPGSEGGVPGVDETALQENLVELLTFRLLREEFAFRVSDVEEIVRYQLITKVPTMAGYVLGITSLRGKIIPVIDLRARLNLRREPSQAGPPRDTASLKGNRKDGEKILIVSGPKGLIGATVDTVMGVIRTPDGEILDPPAHLTEAELRFIEGIVILEKRFISIIKPDVAMDTDVA